MENDYLNDLITVFRIVSLVGFIITGVFVTAIIYRKYQKYFPKRIQEKRWPFIPIALLTYLILLFIYNFLF